MVTEQPKVSAAGRYSTTATCALLGLHRNTLRRYKDQGIIKCGYHKSNMRPFYTGLEILKFWNLMLVRTGR